MSADWTRCEEARSEEDGLHPRVQQQQQQQQQEHCGCSEREDKQQVEETPQKGARGAGGGCLRPRGSLVLCLCQLNP